MISCCVVIPSKDRPYSVIKSLESVFSQSVLPTEVIVVDDGSDPELELNDKISIPDNVSLRLIRNAQSMGAPFSRNLGVKNCSTDIVLFLDDDDFFSVDKIEKVIKEFEDEEVGLVTSYSQVFIKDLGIAYRIKPNANPNLRNQLEKNVIGTTSMMCIRRSVFSKAEGFDELLAARQDYEFGIRLLQICQKTVCIPEVLVNINVELSEKSISKSVDKNVKAINYIEQKYHEELKQLTPSERRSRALANNNFLAHKMLISGNVISAIAMLFKSGVRFRSISSLLAGFSLCLGRKMFFRVLSIRNR
ncbi:glycosyltransferase family 2 protein [Marinobacter sp. HL-58]|uniref:glycosyltransferase family 2 protein n=1 Tax=Marinobacter sp. HL-58 TaxID=1479237 RepID=UPI0006DB5394|nr:glycosyltransferase family 2 protein [Marinobacter sp. HL-58]KPQ02365.1 MAG: putative glycosyltransferase [Marinobacter sp. HL-58]